VTYYDMSATYSRLRNWTLLYLLCLPQL